METFIKADIFFFVTTVCLVVITLLASVLMLYIILLVRNIYIVSLDTKKEVLEILDAMKKTREYIEEKGSSVAGFVSAIMPKEKPVVKKRVRKARVIKE